MGERRKRKSLWDKEAEVETKPFPKQDSEIHNGVSNLAPKLRDGSVQPSSRSIEKDPIAQMNGRSRENAPQGKEVGRVNSHYQKMSPEFEHNRSLENDRGHSRRHPRRGRSRSRSRSRSRTRGRSRSRSLSRGRERERVRRRSRSRSRSKGRGRTRSRSPLGDNRSQKRSKNEVPCRNFVKGKCRWGDTCRFSHHSASEDASLEGTKRLSSDKDSRWAHSSGDENINLHQNGENVLPPNIDLHSLIEKHQHTIGTKGMLETNASNHVEFPNQRSENEEKNAVGVSQEPLNPRENGRNNNELENHVEKGDNPAPENQESDEAKRVAEQSKEVEKTIHSETLEGQGRGEEDIANKDDKETRLFKNHLIEFVKEILKPTWKEGRMSREVHKTIVKKVVEKITSTIQAEHIPKTQEKVEQYLSFSKPKIAKLVQAYVDRCLKPDS